ncbi:MAG: RnfH family protein [Legionella sp. 40-6]|nr:RnfH family protein [Legionella sp.]OJY29399.1 MAG: RnfH family protein [Legionella sp. 40-6]
MVNVELVYVSATQQLVHKYIQLPDKSTVEDALISSGIYDEYPEVATLAVGIYSRRVSKETLLNEGDRIELYRSLIFDPKEKRRLNAKGSR